MVKQDPLEYFPTGIPVIYSSTPTEPHKKNVHFYMPTQYANIPLNIHKKRRAARTSQYKGVTWDRGVWVARVYSQGTNYRLGSFQDETLAAQAVNLKCCELNIPQRNPSVGIGPIVFGKNSIMRKRNGSSSRQNMCSRCSGKMVPGMSIQLVESWLRGHEVPMEYVRALITDLQTSRPHVTKVIKTINGLAPVSVKKEPFT